MNNIVAQIKAAKNKAEKVALLKMLIKKREQPRHPVDIEADNLFTRIQKWGERYNGLELNPEFQRGHVWKTKDQIKYIEALLRGTLPRQAKTITLNICGFQGDIVTGDLKPGVLVVDGLQRINAINDFMNNKFDIFGGINVDDIKDTSYELDNHNIHVAIYDYQNYETVLDMYIDMNDTGISHPKEEIDRVKLIRAKIVQ